MLGLVAAGGLLAQAEDPGHFEVRSGSLELIDGDYYVDALIYLRLPTEAANALHSRLPLTIRVEVEFLNRLRLWWDNVQFEASRRSQLTYYPLTDRYVVTHIDTGVREDFVTLAGALEFIGRVDRLYVTPADLLDRDLRYDIRVRAVLDKDELPGPLRLLAFWRRDWSIASDWLLWRLDDE
ncbi:MAG: DUF4390 domain-containing protein [Gammaproteobacteria bacterium]|jgi:hypothetical protein